MTIFGILFCAFCVSLAVSEKDPPSNLVQTFLDSIKSQGYDTKTPPAGWNGYGTPIKVVTTMYILDIHKVDDFNLDYTAQFYFRQSWNDSRLQYEYPNVESIILRDLDNIWTPDLFFIEEKDGRMNNLLGPNIFCKIWPNGSVKCSERVSIKFSCPMDFRKYPHDVQKCTFNIESYAYTRDIIELNWDNSSTDVLTAAKKVSLLDFDLVDVKPSAKDASFAFGEYRALQVHLMLRRKVGFFTTRLYVPFIILVLVAWLSFWIKIKERVLRFSLLLVVLYLMVSLGAEVNDYIPPAPYTKGSDVWIAVCESLVFASFLELLIVSLIARKEKKMKKKHCKGDVEIPVVVDAKEKIMPKTTDSLTSSANFISFRLKENSLSHRIDFICKVLYPLLFLLFNVVYWSVYCSGN